MRFVLFNLAVVVAGTAAMVMWFVLDQGRSGLHIMSAVILGGCVIVGLGLAGDILRDVFGRRH